MLAKHTFHAAVKWAYAMNWGERGFSALFTFILAAILGPRDFGIVAIAMVYIAFLQMFIDQGMVAAIIQRRDLRPEHLDSVFWFDLVLCATLMGLSLSLSGWWAHLNRLAELSSVISALSVSLPLQGLGIVQRAVLQRGMDFKSLSLRSNVSVVAGGVVGLLMALMGYGVWALVGQRLTQDLTALCLLWTLSHWRPGWRFSSGSLKEILVFSSAGFVGGIGTFIHFQADAFLIGMFFGPVTIGLYRLAQRQINVILDSATNSVQVVSLSEFSKFQNDPTELRRSVLTCIRLSSMTTIPVLAGLAMSSNLIMAAIGPQWALAADPLKVLCLLGMALAFANFTGPLLTALSRPLFTSILVWAVTGVNLGGLVLASLWLSKATTWWQLMGIALTRLAVEALLITPLYVFILLRHSGVSLRELLKTGSPALVAASAVGAAVWLLSTSSLIRVQEPIIALFLVAAIGGLIGLAAIVALDAQVRKYVLGVYTRVFRAGTAASS